MNADGISPSCDVGAHERCAGCACGCHKDTSSTVGVNGEVIAPGAGGTTRHTAADTGSLIVWDPHRDHRTLIQALSAAIPGAIALTLLVVCVVLASEGFL